ncbi:MAG: M20/M25/M40 family metallo-hydrolase [Elusimicrobia bacterium]|nr:M20/M25/M40 family metallo-hydrolase [Elusimicrobiota bacterium]
MKLLSFVLWVLSLSIAPAAASQPDFDQGVKVRPAIEIAREGASKMAGAQADAPADAGQEESVWITISKEDVAALGNEFGFPSRPALAAGAKLSVYRLSVGELDRLTEVMHRKFRRTGYIAHPTEAEAREAAFAPEAVPAARAHTIDQPEVVEPMVARVEEAEIGRVVGQLASYKNRYYRSETGAAASRWVLDRWAELAQGRSDISAELFPHSWTQASVILSVNGAKNPDQFVVLGGHIDSIAGYSGADAAAPGADDNASGVAILTEAIRVLVKSGYRPSKTLKFIAYSAEEVGLRGSKAISSTFKAKDVHGVVNFDMANYHGSAEDIVLITDYADSSQNAFLGKLMDRYTGARWGTTKCGYGCSDHASWTSAGFSASFPFEAKMGEDNPNIHSARDTAAQMGGDFQQAAKFAKLALAYLVETAK